MTIPEPPVESVPRLVIEKMVLINFKSYAGRQEIGPFHKSFTSVVGPNGSGKSNVIDALLFVFGYRASKMRQGKLSELIHNSSGAEDLDSCTVEIHFCEILDLVSTAKEKLLLGKTLAVQESILLTTKGPSLLHSLDQIILSAWQDLTWWSLVRPLHPTPANTLSTTS